MNPYIYRDTVTEDRVLIPIEQEPNGDYFRVIECWVWNGRPKFRSIQMSQIILDRYYKKETL
jgi:hypothetical protein